MRANDGFATSDKKVASRSPGTWVESLWLLPSGPDQIHDLPMRGDPPLSGARYNARTCIIAAARPSPTPVAEAADIMAATSLRRFQSSARAKAANFFLLARAPRRVVVGARDRADVMPAPGAAADEPRA